MLSFRYVHIFGSVEWISHCLFQAIVFFIVFAFGFGLIFCLTEFAINCTLHRLSIVRVLFGVHVAANVPMEKGVCCYSKNNKQENNKRCSHKCGTSAYIIKAHQSRQTHNAIAHRSYFFSLHNASHGVTSVPCTILTFDHVLGKRKNVSIFLHFFIQMQRTQWKDVNVPSAFPWIHTLIAHMSERASSTLHPSAHRLTK